MARRVQANVDLYNGKFPEKNIQLAENYCRNPGNQEKYLWCFVHGLKLK